MIGAVRKSGSCRVIVSGGMSEGNRNYIFYRVDKRKRAGKLRRERDKFDTILTAMKQRKEHGTVRIFYMVDLLGASLFGRDKRTFHIDAGNAGNGGSGASIRSEAVLKISFSFSGGSVMEVGQNVVMPQDFK